MSDTDGMPLSAAAVIVGTAGHVDHGKSSLVLALTGTGPDRLPQEKTRGITIDLGFAELVLPSGRAVGVVDVPGHEHYVRAMAAGAAGVDVALLVVAADDGVMPQTREHLRILEAFGARHMVVALSKADLVDPDWLGLVQLDVEEFLAGTLYAGAPVVPVSVRTGTGLDELLIRLDEAVDAFLAEPAAQTRQARPPRLSVDRSFNVAGAGAVVTGTLRSGVLHPGDTVEILPAKKTARVRSVQTYGRDVDAAVAGQRTALNLAGVALDDLPRGSTVCAPDTLFMHDRFDARLHWFGRDGTTLPLESGERVHVCAGTAQALGRVLLFDGAGMLECGDDALVQIRLEEPLVLAAHDRFVVMSYSPVELTGGGEVLWTQPPRRSMPTADERALLEAVAADDDHGAVMSAVRCAIYPASPQEIASSLDLPLAHAETILKDAAANGELTALDRGASGTLRYTDTATLDALMQAVLDALAHERTVRPSGSGLSLAALRDAACPRMDLSAFGAIIARMEDAGLVGRFDAAIVAAEDVGRVRRDADELAERVTGALETHGLSPSSVDELSGELALPEPLVRRGLTLLTEAGRAVMIDRSYVLGSEAYREVCTVIARTIRAKGGRATASELREALGLTRKYTMPLLEYLDRVRFTERNDDEQGTRRLVEEGRAALQ